MREELVETVLRVVEEIPEGRAATYGMIARAVGTGPRVVGRIMGLKDKTCWFCGDFSAC